MKKQVKLTETELFDVIEESVKSLVMEYGEKNPKVRSAMAKAAKRALDNGDDETYHRAVKSIADAGGSNEALQDFNDKFEKESLNSQPANNLATNENRQAKVTESQLKDIIRESVYMVLNEAFKSPKLDAIARQHGGINRNGYGYLNGYEVPISDLTDDMIGDEAQKLDYYGYADNAVNFKDGTSVPIIDKEGAGALKQQKYAMNRQRGKYISPRGEKPVFPKGNFGHALRSDLSTANRLRQSSNPDDVRKYNSHWKDFEKKARPKIRQAYNGERDLSADTFWQ